MRKKKALLERQALLLEEERAQLDRLKAADQGLAGEELTAHETRRTELSAIAEELAGFERLEARTRENAIRTGGSAQVFDNAVDRPWASFGEQLQAIVKAGMPNGGIDPRLYQSLAPSGGSATVPSDGGFLIHPDFSAEIFKRAYDSGLIASRCTRIPIGANSDSLEIPMVAETSRVDGSRWGGVQVYRAAETDAATPTRPKLDLWTCRLETLKGLAYASERLLEDASAMEAVYRDAFASEFAFKLDDEIVNGDGAGKCLGVLNAPCLVSVAKEGSQTAATVNLKNIVKMRSRLWSRSRATSVWLVNQDVEPQLQQLALEGTASSVPAWMPAGGFSGAPFDTLYGRPVIPVEQCATLGTKGDILLCDFSQYVLIDKGGLRAASSMHVRFIYDEMTFKYSMRVNGAPKWKAPLTPFKGTNTLSTFVSLDTRS